MHPSKLSRSELIAALGGVLLGIGISLPWYVPNKDNRNAVVAGSREAVSAWDAHTYLRFLFLAAALAPMILAYIVLRDHQLSWPRSPPSASSATWGSSTARASLLARSASASAGFCRWPA